ncbi:translation initiation factor [Sandaracinus amylolyticus]|uniref:Translation initiation factor SUI1-related protein n=1 Tax=Sandaracinus amylolyticus TaxID=927083 RepID=A0A0F6SEW9_9BACT|nr:translation initiation factor [Sandaracinus amylolyticus]AKF05924.1 Translation initiation factor SUI1-related protein [Sandaracinus amylolyticus]
MADPKKPSSPFSSLASLRDALPAGPERAPAPAPSAPAAKDPFAAKIVVAKSRKGRGGKTVTTIAGIAEHALEAITKELKHALGTGATIEDGEIVVQGEHGPRIKQWLEQRGAKRVVLGS